MRAEVGFRGRVPGCTLRRDQSPWRQLAPVPARTVGAWPRRHGQMVATETDRVAAEPASPCRPPGGQLAAPAAGPRAAVPGALTAPEGVAGGAPRSARRGQQGSRASCRFRARREVTSAARVTSPPSRPRPRGRPHALESGRVAGAAGSQPPVAREGPVGLRRLGSQARARSQLTLARPGACPIACLLGG